ncbi:MAG TPA: multicopper oxidase family protein [Candidatus Binatia bacterium]|nr:multicopper oxidase family protein [Candidatus Binatia bacterium]
MNRRTFIGQTTAALAAAALKPKFAWPQTQPDFRIEIAPLNLEIAPGKVVHTVAYNGRVPGPLIRWPEGKPIAIDVVNRTSIPEIVHWHGMEIASAMDGAVEEGSAMIPPGGQFRYLFTPRPAGFRWYHTHAFAGRDLKRSTYTGQFGGFYVEPKSDPGAYDLEFFLTLHDWNAYLAAGGDSSMDAAYDYSTIDGRMLGFADPLKVREGQRVLLHILNASASMIHWLALAGHEMTVVAMDGNPVPTPASTPAVRLGPAERLDVLVTMDHPGAWILGETREPLRKAGMGIVIEYADQQSKPRWVDPPETLWDYRRFAKPEATIRQPDHVVPLKFEAKFHGQGAIATWTINGKSFPHSDTIMLKEGQRYRLQMMNRSGDDHPVHLHRHTFEVSDINSQPLSGLNKDVVIVPANGTVDADFTANNPGATLFHCHNQTHMDSGFMTLLRYS